MRKTATDAINQPRTRATAHCNQRTTLCPACKAGNQARDQQYHARGKFGFIRTGIDGFNLCCGHVKFAKYPIQPKTPKPARAGLCNAPALVQPVGRGSKSNLQPSVLETDALPIELYPYKVLGNDLGNYAHTHGTATFADSEAQTFFHGDGASALTVMETLSPGITISLPGQLDRTGHVRGTEVELGTVVAEEGV